MKAFEVEGIFTGTNIKRSDKINADVQNVHVTGKLGKAYSAQVRTHNSQVAALTFGTPVQLRFVDLDYLMQEQGKAMSFRSATVSIIAKA